MRFNLLFTCLPLLLVALIGTNASPVGGGGQYHTGEGHDSLNGAGKAAGGGSSTDGWGGLGGGRSGEVGSSDGFGSDGNINKNSPQCQQLVDESDRLPRSNVLEVIEDSPNPSSYRSWQGSVRGGRRFAVIFTDNSEGYIEVHLWNPSGIKFPNKIEVSPRYNNKAFFPVPTKWILDPSKGDACQFLTGRLPNMFEDVTVRY